MAYKRVRKDQGDDFIPDILELRDVDLDRKDTVDKLRDKLESGYEPSNLLQIDVPKKGYAPRPGSNLIPEDRIVYQAIVDYISSRVEEPPPDVCFSYRLKRKADSGLMFQFWRPWWLKWRRKMREVYANGYRCLLKTDIAAYYEQIDHDIFVRHVLNGKVKEGEVIYLLRKLLSKWAISDIKHIGIPQGCDASTYIGNVYLTDLDKNMIRQGIIGQGFKYFRWNDEIYALTKDKREARKAMQVITHQLRKLHLNIQETKTDIIIEPEKVEQEIGTEEEDKIRDFDYEFQRKPKTGKTEEPEEEIIKRYKEATRNGRAKPNELDIRKFRWCINRLYKTRSDIAVNFVLARLADLPFLAASFTSYLTLFINRKSVKDKIIDFLDSEDNIWEWQEMWLLLTLSKAKKLDDKHLQVLRKIIMKKERHWASRAIAIFALGKLGDDTDRKWLRDLYRDEDNDYVKRAIAVSIHSLPKSLRNKFYAEIEKDSYHVERLVKYLKQEHIETI